MFAKIEEVAKGLNQGSQRVHSKARRAREYLREEFTLDCVREATGWLGKVHGLLERYRDQMLLDRICAEDFPVDDLGEILWDDVPEVYGVFDGAARPYKGPCSISNLPETRILQTRHAMREEAQKRGQEAAQAYQEALETQRQERIEKLAGSLSEALEGNLGGASLSEVLFQVCKMQVLTWEAVRAGITDPRTPFKELLTMNPAPEQTAEMKSDPEELQGE